MEDNSFYIFHHLGLGDHILCNGLVREFKEKYENLNVFCHPFHFGSVDFMYRDDNNINVLPIGGFSDIQNYITKNNLGKKTIRVTDVVTNGISWDQSFYTTHGIDFAKRWEKFKVVRDFSGENNLYNELNTNNEKFVLIHSAGSDNIDRIDYSKIDNTYKKIFVKKYTENIFDFLGLIEKAEEIHCVESSFHLLVDSIQLNDNLFFHTLSKNRGFSHKIKDKWKIV
jgi:hypothetical protein